MITKHLMLVLALLVLTACQDTSNVDLSEEPAPGHSATAVDEGADDSADESADEPAPLGNLDLLLAGQRWRTDPNRDDDGAVVPGGTQVVIEVTCFAARDEPVVRLIWPDNVSDEDAQGLPRNTFNAHLLNHPDLGSMKVESSYRVYGEITHGGRVDFSAFWINVDRFEPLD